MKEAALFDHEYFLSFFGRLLGDLIKRSDIRREKKILFSDWLKLKRTIEWKCCSSKKVVYFQLCGCETSKKANCFHCLILLIYAIACAVLFGRRPKLPEWDTAFKDCFHALFFDLKLPILFFRRSRAVFQKRSNLSW